MSMARVIARWVDDSLESPFAVDVAIESERIVGPSIAFGCIDWEGSPKPFVLDESGRIDFGTGKFWSCDLREQVMRVGSTFRVDFGMGDEGTYRIVKIAVPGSRG
jgi:hypothetical protein